MKDDITQYDQIERYLDGTMSEEEKASFETAISADSELEKEVKLSLEARELIVDHNLLSLKAKLQTFQPTSSPNWKKWGVLSALLLFLSCVGIYTYTSKEEVEIKKDSKTPLSTHEKKDLIQNTPILKDSLPETNTPSAQKSNAIISEKPEQNTLKKEKVKEEDTTRQTLITKEKEVKQTKTGSMLKEANTTGFACEHFHLTYKTQKENTCAGKQSGEITITEVNGGKPPYTFSLDADNYQSEGLFRNLASGAYTVVIKDQNSCVDIADITIENKLCGPEYVKAFNPDMGEKWEIPYDSDKSGIFKVLNRKSQVVFTGTFAAKQPAFWNGSAVSGELLPMGYYIFEIHYEDGTTFGGGVSIVR